MDSAKVLQDRAREQTGFDSFGCPSYQEGLDRLLWSLAHEARFSEFGRAAHEAQIIETLSQRLQIEHWYLQHPEIDDEEIVAPLIGLGLPRTGSTAFASLLGEDTSARSLRTWEVISPVPPPEKATEHTDPRIEQARKVIAQLDSFAPRLRTMLPSSPTAPQECHSFMAYDFKSHAFASQAHIPSYMHWLLHEADLVPTYAYLKRTLKLLQWRCPNGRWRLKNPSHILFIAALDKVFPDAMFWMTHRNIASVIPSCADLHYELTQGYTETCDKAFIAQSNTEVWEIGMRRLLAFRNAGNEGRFIDIYFEDFQRDPFPGMERLYAFLGEEFTAETRERMAAWRANTPRGQHGNHTYDIAEFSIDLDRLGKTFEFYHARFGGLTAS